MPTEAEDRREQQTEIAASYGAWLAARLAFARAAGGSGLTSAQRIERAVSALAERRISAAAFERLARSELFALYLGSFNHQLGIHAGGARATFAEARALDQMVRLQQEPLIRHWAEQIGRGVETVPPAERAAMYADSAHTAGQMGVMAAAIRLGKRVAWRRNSAKDSCRPCVTAEAGGPYPPGTLPGLPGYPYCEGGVRCGCVLVLVD